MNFTVFNSIILFATIPVIAMAAINLVRYRAEKTMLFFYGFLVSSNLVILQVMLIDVKLTVAFPLLLLFFVPFQFLSPVLFTGFTCSYLERTALFRKYGLWLLLPFILFFLVYTFFKANVIADYSFLPKRTMEMFGAELDENLAVIFSLVVGFWNYRIIRSYELGLGNLPYQLVVKRTKWLRTIYTTLIILCLLWVVVILIANLNDNFGSHKAYYPLWMLFILFHYIVFYFGVKHLKRLSQTGGKGRQALKEVATEFQLKGLNRIFASNELQYLDDHQYEVTAILSYFATSLFDKHKEEEVLWDITKNCIAKLNLEDCVVYILDKRENKLVQKAAFGNKEKGQKKILSPIDIPFGEGIVGTVAKTKRFEWIPDVSQDSRYIVDDQHRRSELAVPIIFDDEVLGVLDSEHSQAGFFTDRHLFLFQLISKLTATKLQQLSKKTAVTITNDNAYFKELCYLLKEENLFRNAELNLRSASEKLNISSNYLSQLVNRIAACNFSDFVNKYRVEDAKAKLTDAEFDGYTMLAIGLEAGFNSKSTFYNAFKKHAGMSPTDYKEKHPIKSSIF